MDRKTVLIPAYEPDEQLLRFLRELKAAGFRNVIVDDGSGPAYREIFTKAEAYGTVLSYEKNKGKGHALKEGLRYISAHTGSRNVVITADADGQHKAEDVARTGEEAEEHPGSLILGCRKFSGKVPLRSRLGNGITRLVFRAATGAGLQDTQTGLRAFSADLIPFLLGIPGERYEYEMNMLTETVKQKIPLGEVEIKTVYLNGNAGSHFNTLRDSFLIYRDILRFAASSFLSFILDYTLFFLFSFVLSGFGTVAAASTANILARVFSASFNYTINRKYVFRRKDNPAAPMFQYAALASGILFFNTILLDWLIAGMGMNRYVAKVLTEITFFTLSFLTQKFLIFGKRRETA